MPVVGEPIYLNLQLFDGASNKFPLAYLFDENGVPLSPVSQVSLTHIGDGLYVNKQISFPGNTDQVKVSYKVFDDALHTIPSRSHSNAIDVFNLEPEIIVVNRESLVGSIEDGTLVGSFVSPDSVVGNVLDGSIVGDFDEVTTYVGQLLEDQDEVVPGAHQEDGTVVGDVLC